MKDDGIELKVNVVHTWYKSIQDRVTVPYILFEPQNIGVTNFDLMKETS